MANRSMAAKVMRAKTQTIALMQHEMGKAFYLGKTKPEVPEYNLAMVRRFEAPKPKSRTYATKEPKGLIARGGLLALGWN